MYSYTIKQEKIVAVPIFRTKGKASDDGTEKDFAARLVEEELSRFPRLKAKVTPKQKQRLAEIVRKHLQNTIESMDEAV